MEALTEVESEVIDVDDIDEGEKESCLVGRLVTEEHWNPSNLIEDITKAWTPKHGMSSSVWEESKLILFRFDDVIDRDWALLNQPWQFNGSLFAIQKFTGGNEQQMSSSKNNVTIEHASFWVRLYDVPFSCMNERSLSLFAKQIGILEYVYASGEDLIGTFIWFKVSMNIRKPLVRGITIRVEGKHLWLALKYESLPIYCFSCGIIGHDYNNCKSYNRNLAYSTLELRATEEQEDTPTTLPHDIVENILSRLPAKYLIRYKSVCKLWEATISDPRFAEMHLQQYKNSSSRNLLAWEHLDNYYKGLHVAEIQDKYLEFVSGIQHSGKYSLCSGFLCNCDGLYMKCFETCEGRAYLLWNPSCRVYREIQTPQRIDDEQLYAIYYNPLMKDYKIVIANTKHYAVLSCRYNKWGEVKEMKETLLMESFSFRSGVYCLSGVSLNGSFYWLSEAFCDFEIICFDGEVEKFKKLPMPNYCKENSHGCSLTSSGSHLYLSVEYYSSIVVNIWKRVGGDETDSWMEFKVELPCWRFMNEVQMPSPICWVNEGEVMFDIDKYYHLLYDLNKNAFEWIEKDSSTMDKDLVIYQENIFLQ